MMFRWDPHRPGLNSVWNVTTFFETRLHLGLMNECFRDSSSYKVDFVWEGINCAHSSDSSISLVPFCFAFEDLNFACAIINFAFSWIKFSMDPLLPFAFFCKLWKYSEEDRNKMKNGMRLMFNLIEMWNQIDQSISK